MLFFVCVTTPIPSPGHPEPCLPDKVRTSKKMSEPDILLTVSDIGFVGLQTFEVSSHG